MRRFILIFMALLFHVVSYPQKVTQSSYCYKDRKGIVYVRKFIVYNNTKEDLLTWISPFPVNMISDKRKVRDFREYANHKLVHEKLLTLRYLKKANPEAYAYVVKTDEIMK